MYTMIHNTRIAERVRERLNVSYFHFKSVLIPLLIPPASLILLRKDAIFATLRTVSIPFRKLVAVAIVYHVTLNLRMRINAQPHPPAIEQLAS